MIKSCTAKIYCIVFGFILLNLFNLACSKDNDLLNDIIRNEAPEDSAIIELDPPDINAIETSITEEIYENRFKSFPPIHDAFVQSGKGFNQNLMRLEKENRTGYLMFDLTPIQTVGGTIKAVTLQFTVKYDEDEGMINIYQGDSNDWTEGTLTAATAPSTEIELGSLSKKFLSNQTEYINLNHELFELDQNSLVVTYSGNNQISLASKEHVDKVGPKLVVTYEVPEGAEEIILEEEEYEATPENSESEVEEEEEEEETIENEAPMARAEANVTQGIVPLQVNFDASNSNDDKEIIRYLWDFKDGGGSSNPSPTHTFTEVGSYEVLLTVTDNEGVSNTDTITIIVSDPENQAPKAVLTANVTSGTAPLEVSFTGSDSTDDKAVVSYSWDFKDGGGSTNNNPTHTFTQTGSYEVTLTVADESGLTNTATITIVVEEQTNEAPTAIANSDLTSGEAPLTVNFLGNQSTDDKGITAYYWDFKDGTTSTEVNPTHTFQTPGTYLIEFVVTDENGLTDTDIDTIIVTEAEGNTSNYPPNAVMASSFGFQTGDASEAFRDALNSNHAYIVVDKQTTDWVIEPMKLFDVANKTIVFEPGVVLKAKSGAFASASAHLFQLIRPSNLSIEGYNASFRMNKPEYTNGEGRHALSIYSGTNITIKGLQIQDSGGDGIYISGGGGGNTYSSNITLEDLVVTNHKRMAMTIISAQGVWVRNCEFSGSNGVHPEAGVDLEPNKPEERLVNINFNNCVFKNNDSHGLVIGTNKLNSASLPIDITIKDSEFSNNSLAPNATAIKAELLLSQGVGNDPVKGNVNLEGLTFRNSNNGALFSRKSADSYAVSFKDCSAYNVANSGVAGGLIELHASSTENTLGGYDFGNFYMEYSVNVPFMKILAPNTAGFQVKDISGNFTIKSPNNSDIKYSGGYNPSNNSNVNITYQHIQ